MLAEILSEETEDVLLETVSKLDLTQIGEFILCLNTLLLVLVNKPIVNGLMFHISSLLILQ